MRTSAKQAALRLKGLGFPIVSVSEPSPEEDGEVKITTDVHVQVGYDYVNVTRQIGEGDNLEFVFYPEAATYEQLAKDIRAAIADSDPTSTLATEEKPALSGKQVTSRGPGW